VYRKYSMRGRVERFIQHKALVLYESLDTPPRAVFLIHTSIGGALSAVLYFLVIWFREVFELLQILVIRISLSV